MADFKNTISKGGKKYNITFVDDFSRYTNVYLLKLKDETGEMIVKYKAKVKNQLDKKIKRLRTDRGGEYSTKFLKEFCEINGIIHETTAPSAPLKNSITERKNKMFKEMRNAMLLSYGLSNNMWGEAILSACYIFNKVPHKKLDKTPYELWKGFAPNLNYLKVWGCLAKVGFPKFRKTNIGPKIFYCIFVGYAQTSAAYRFMYLGDNSICESKDAQFFVIIFPLKSYC